MSTVNVSANMNLPIPVVGIDLGPDWALNIDVSLALIDLHDHSTGKGVPVTPSGINISSDLTFSLNNATNLRSVRFSNNGLLAGANDLGCLYESGGELYYNDALGNQVKITQNGSVVVSNGNISGLVSPASATYSAGTFVWQSDVNTAANLDAASIVLRTTTPSSPGLTLSPPSGIASDYAINLPALPGSKELLFIDSSGNMTTGTTNVVSSASCGSYSTSSATPANVTNLSATITSSGGPIFIGICPDGGTSQNILEIESNGSTSIVALIYVFRGGTQIALHHLRVQAALDSGALDLTIPVSIFSIDVPGAGTHTYTINAAVLAASANPSLNLINAKLFLYEIR